MEHARLGLVAAAALAFAPCAAGDWLGLREVPLERILPQLEQRVQERPRDAHSHYLLGRARGAAFGRRADSIRMYYEDRLDARDPHTGDGAIGARPLQDRDPGPGPGSEDSVGHLTRALTELLTAVELAPEDALYRIGLACAFDEGRHLAALIDSRAVARAGLGALTEVEFRELTDDLAALAVGGEPERAKAEARIALLGARAIPVLARYRADPDVGRQLRVAKLLSGAWGEAAIASYERAFALAFERDKQQTSLHLDTRPALISLEAATAWIRLVKERGVRGEAEARRLAELEAGLAVLGKIPTWITPILVPDRADATLSTLFDGETAEFDLSGAGVPQTWEWPTAAASFLVWDPECTGEIRSGRQLFGSATWWMFCEDGYRALALLDQDGDAWLTGAELDGLALWHDANRDGRSDPGEVESLDSRGLVALATQPDGVDGLAPTCSRGMLTAGGRWLPTFDWVATPFAPKP